MIRLFHTASGNYDIDTLENDDIVVDTQENVIVINKQKHPFMSITDVIDTSAADVPADSSVAMSRAGVKHYIIDTEETYSATANALKAENAEMKLLIEDLQNRVQALEDANA